MEYKTLHNLSLHETLDINETVSATRVSGGWIYMTYHKTSQSHSTIFVPYSEELIEDTSSIDVEKDIPQTDRELYDWEYTII